MILRKALSDCPAMTTTWPPKASELGGKTVQKLVPKQLYALVAWAVGESDDPEMTTSLSTENDIKILSICQDIIYLKSQGRIPTPKSLSLALTVRHLTGSAKVIDLLHKFGHTVSYSSTLQLESSLAQLRLLQQNDIPEGFHPRVHTNLVWDNIDFNEETLTGAGTTHHTNGILIQSNVERNTDCQTRPSIGKTRRLIIEKAKLPNCYVKERKGPSPIADHIMISLENCKQLLIHANYVEFWYVMVKLVDGGDLPSWTAFNINLQKSNLLQKSLIHYLPVIEYPPTDLAAAKEILCKSVTIADRLQLDEITLVFDQAIYCKAQQLRWSNNEFKQRTVVRLGEFHTAMSFLKVIGKRFCDAGLQDIMVESGIVAVGSVNGVMSGHHYNGSCRAHKLVYEAL